MDITDVTITIIHLIVGFILVFFAGMSHGLMLLDGLDSISFSLAIVMTVSMISGLILKFASDRSLKFFGRLVHGQVILSILLVSLVTLHVMTTGGDFD